MEAFPGGSREAEGDKHDNGQGRMNNQSAEWWGNLRREINSTALELLAVQTGLRTQGLLNPLEEQRTSGCLALDPVNAFIEGNDLFFFLLAILGYTSAQQGRNGNGNGTQLPETELWKARESQELKGQGLRVGTLLQQPCLAWLRGKKSERPNKTEEVPSKFPSREDQ